MLSAMVPNLESFASHHFVPRRISGRMGLLVGVLLCLAITASARGNSFYTQRLEDPKAVYVVPSGADDTAVLQQAVDRVQETTGQGIVFLAPGEYSIRDTLYIWPGIRLIGYGDARPI